MPDDSCMAFDSFGAIDADFLNRFVVGADPAPRRMTTPEVRALGDVFAATFFAKGKVPRTAQQIVDGIKSAAPKNRFWAATTNLPAAALRESYG